MPERAHRPRLPLPVSGPSPRRSFPGPRAWIVLLACVAAFTAVALSYEWRIRSDARERVRSLGEHLERSINERIDLSEETLQSVALLFPGSATKEKWDLVAAGLGRQGRHAEFRQVRTLAAAEVLLADGAETVDPIRGAALRCRDSGLLVLTAGLDPLQPGTLVLVAPVFEAGMPTEDLEGRREAFRGAVVGYLDAAHLVGRSIVQEDGPIRAELFAGAEAIPALRLWAGGPGGDAAPGYPPTIRAFRAYGLDFLLRLTLCRGYLSLSEGIYVLMIIGVGIVVGLLAFALVWSRERTSLEARRMAAEATRTLADALERNRVLLASTPLGVVEWDASFRARTLNAVAERIFQVPAAEAAGREGVEFLADASDGPRLWEAMSRPDGGRALATARVADGRTIDCEWSFAPLLDGSGRLTGAVSLVEDLTARQEAEASARESQKMEAIGRLAGGVAHDFNNLLTAILGYAELLEIRVSKDEKSVSHVREIRRAGERASALTRQLLAFGRRQVLKVQRLDLNASVTQASELLGRLLGERVRLRLDLAPDLWPVQADPGQIEQVLVNLAVNARDAMPEGGTLSFVTKNVEIPAEGRSSAAPALPPGAWALLSVIDTGQGMDEQVRARIFEPFFTTKARGRGTGLGLATVYGIVRQSGAHILVKSAPGEGSTFDLYLSRTFDPRPASPSGGLPSLNTGGSETILLVEDEESVRTLARRILVESGYTVLDAPDAGQAEHVVATHERTIHLLLTDVILPGGSGPELAARLAERLPALKVLFVSGYPDEALGRQGVLEEQVAFLQKPFSPLALRQRVREVLDTPRGARSAEGMRRGGDPPDGSPR